MTEREKLVEEMEAAYRRHFEGRPMTAALAVAEAAIRADEREVCAKVADYWDRSGQNWLHREAGRLIAAAIRARGGE